MRGSETAHHGRGFVGDAEAVGPGVAFRAVPPIYVVGSAELLPDPSYGLCDSKSGPVLGRLVPMPARSLLWIV
jgi:hypothetical protein